MLVSKSVGTTRLRWSTCGYVQQGLALLEVLLAVAVLSLTMVTLLGSQSQSVALITQAQFETTAALLAQEKLTDLRLTDFDDLFNESGEFGEESTDFGWRTEVAALTEDAVGIEGSGDMLKSIVLTVFSTSDQSQSVQVHAIVCRSVQGGDNEP